MNENRKIHKGFKIFLLVFIAFILIIARLNKDDIIHTYSKNSKLEKVLNKEKEYNGKDLYYFNSEFIKWENNLITFMSEDGSNKWIKEFDFIDPYILFGEENIFVIDKSTGDIFGLNSNGETTLRLQSGKPVFNIKESNKNIIIHYKENGVESLEILNDKGKRLHILSTEDKILTYSTWEDGSNYIYSTIKVEGSNLSSKLYLDTFENKNKYSVEFPNEIIIYTEFFSDGILVITDLGIYYTESGEIKWSKDYQSIKDFKILKNKIYMLCDKYMEVISMDGKSLSKVTYEESYDKIIILDKYIILYGSNDFLVILQEGKEVLKYNTEGIIKNITYDDSKMVISYEDKLEVYSFK